MCAEETISFYSWKFYVSNFKRTINNMTGKGQNEK